MPCLADLASEGFRSGSDAVRKPHLPAFSIETLRESHFYARWRYQLRLELR